MTLEQVIEIIKQNGKPYLQLDLLAGLYDRRRVGTFDCQNCLENENEQSKVKKAIDWLVSMTGHFDDDARFALTIKPNPKAGKDSWIGPIEFYKTDKKEQKSTLAGLGGIDPATIQQLGYVPAAQIENERLRFELRLKDKEIEDLKQRCEDEKELIRHEALNWTPERWGQTIEKATALLGVVTGKLPPQQLQGIINNNGADTKQQVSPDQAMRLVIQHKLQELDFEKLKITKAFIDKLINLKRDARGTEQSATEQGSADA